MQDEPDRIFFYDGVCGLCHRFVQVMLALDRDGKFKFAPIQGETAQTFVVRFGADFPTDLSTIIYVEGGRPFVFSDALIAAARHLPAPWSWGRWLAVFPRAPRDVFYRFVAARRYRVFGQYDSCRLPTEKESAQLLP